MRELNATERETIARRKAAFERFLEERMPVLTEFMEDLELPDPAMVLVEAEKYMPALDQWMKDQIVEPDDWTWLLTRIGYFIGEYLVQRFGGHWFLNDIPDSKFFGRYVVGKFRQIPNPNATVDPFFVANDFLSQPPGRQLSATLAEVEHELLQA